MKLNLFDPLQASALDPDSPNILLSVHLSEAGGITVTSSIGSVVITGVDDRVNFPQTVAGASVHLEWV